MEREITKELEALIPNLTELETFIWGGTDMPENDSLWTALRTSCSTLRHIEVNASHIDRSSSLLHFSHLRSFGVNIINTGHRSPEILPDTFWRFLSENQDLEYLCIDTDRVTMNFKISPLLEMRFPKLRTLILGSLVDIFAQTSSFYPDFEKFLDGHPTLHHFRYLELTKQLGPEFLPNLKSFSGSLKMLSLLSIDKSLEKLETLYLCTRFEAEEALKICKYTAPNVEIFSIKFGRGVPLFDTVDTIFKTFPLLTTLCLSLPLNNPPIVWYEFYRVLARTQRLQSLEVNVAYAKLSETPAMQPRAGQIFKSVPTLRSLTLKFTLLGPPNDRLLRIGRFSLALQTNAVTGGMDHSSQTVSSVYSGFEVGVNMKGERDVKTYMKDIPAS